jgi:hydrophobic/amphiphilic exporter-1 (mainly G- bacteria), HAE1 family
MTITELSIKRPIFIIVVFMVLSLLGIFGYMQLKYELIPNINMPNVFIITEYDGAAANEVESTVTEKIEDGVATLDGISSLSSTSSEGYSMVNIEYNQGVDVNFALQDAQRKVNQVISSLPDGVKSPILMKFSTDDMPVLRLGITSNLTDKKLYHLVDKQIKADLSQVPGVGQATLTGGSQQEIKLYLNADKLQAYGLSIVTIQQAVGAANMDVPAGAIKDRDLQYTIRLAGNVENLNDLRELIIGRSKDGGDIRLKDVGVVADGVMDPTTINRVNGKDSLGISITKQTDANAVEMAKLVRDELKRLQTEYANINLQFTVANDTSEYTTNSANAVKEDLFIAILLVAGIMLVFLHSIRNALIVMVAIPASLVSTMIGMWVFGFSLNMLSLLALSLAIGILVDDSIVVLENIHRHLEMGEEQRVAALNGRNEIGFTALSITFVDVAVYLPLSMVTGLVGGMIRQFSLVIVFATLMSLFVSFTLTPLLASRFSKMQELSKKTLMGRFGIWFEDFFESFTKDYLYVLKWSLQHRAVVLLTAVLLFVISLGLVGGGFIGTEFMATGNDQGQYTVSLELPQGTKLTQTNAVTKKVEDFLMKMPETDRIVTTVGTASAGFSLTSTPNDAVISVTSIAVEKRTKTVDEMMMEAKNMMAGLPGVKGHVNIASSFGGSQAPIQLKVTGDSWNDVARAANIVQRVMQTIPGTADVQLSSTNGNPERQIQIDRDKMASFGLTMAEVGTALEYDLTGDTTYSFRDSNREEYDTRIILDEASRARTADIGDLIIVNSQGQKIALKQFATFKHTLGPTKLERYNRNYSITVSSQAIGRPSGSISGDINKALAKQKLPSGTKLVYAGNIKNMTDSFASLALALLAAIIFVYLVMAALYNSFIYPFIVLFSVPLAIIGSLWALALTMNSLNVFSILGIIMEIGLVSKNAILLVDFANKAREDGADVHEALLAAGRERLRPILMTTLTMILGMLPIATANSAGSSLKNGLGWGLIGGLTISMLLTLIVVPIVYTIIDRIQKFFTNRDDGLSY